MMPKSMPLSARAIYPAQIVTKSDLIADDEYIEAMRENKSKEAFQSF